MLLDAAYKKLPDDEIAAWLSGLQKRWADDIRERNLRDMARVREPLIASYPLKMQQRMRAKHQAVFDTADVDLKPGAPSKQGVANGWLHGMHRHLVNAKLTKAYDEDLIRDCAENYARICERLGKTLEGKESFARAIGVEPPSGKCDQKNGRARRLDCPIWWRRALRKTWTRAAENGVREIGIVRKGEEPYASDEAVKHRRNQKRKSQEFMERHALVNEDGEQLELLDVAARSVSNPAMRRGEFMTRAKGFEAVADELGHCAEFYTLTAPSAFHSQLHAGGDNPRFNKETVKAAQNWLRDMWAKTRAKLKRQSIAVYGFRIAEPHHDATPHWHLLLFMAPQHAEDVRFIIKNYWLSEYGDEPGAAEHRCKVEPIDRSRGSAVGYVAKYVAKNIDGAGAIGDAPSNETGNPVSEETIRVDAWASIHGIRQFQQIGGPPVGLWRETRRLRDPVPDENMERARLAADMGDWGEFWRAVTCGDFKHGRRLALVLEREITGVCNRYGELCAPSTVGIRYCSAVAFTRPHFWRIEKKTCATSTLTPPCSPGSLSDIYYGESLSHGPMYPEALASAGIEALNSSSSSTLGPVAITVRPAPGYEWIATVPYKGPRRSGEQSAWTNPRETSQAGPV